MRVILAAIIAAATMYTAAHSADREFTVTGWGGAVQDFRRELMFKPFAEKMNVTVLDDVYTGGWAPFKAMQDTGIIPWDVIHLETAELVRGCEEGLFGEIDWDKIGNKDDYIDGAVHKCGVGTNVFSIVLAYNSEKITDAGNSTAIFWDVEKYPGKRGMRQGPTTNLEFALMADGVDPKDVYSVLATEEGVDRAFAKLGEIKPHLQFWKSGAQAPEWLVAGDVIMSTAYNGRIGKAIDEGKPLTMVWDNTLYDWDFYVIPAKSPHVDLAHEFIKYVHTPKTLATYANNFAYGPTVKSAVPMIEKERFRFLPAGDNLKTGLHIGSEEAREFWADHLEQLTQRWNTWAAS